MFVVTRPTCTGEHLEERSPTHGENICMLGKYEQAEPLYKRALAIREQRLGPENRSTAAVLSDLALLYMDQGKYQQAETLFQRALAIEEQHFKQTIHIDD